MWRHDAFVPAVWSKRDRPRHVEVHARIQSQGHAVSRGRTETAARGILLLANARCGNHSEFRAIVAAVGRLDPPESRKGIGAVAEGSLRRGHPYEGLFAQLKR